MPNIKIIGLSMHEESDQADAMRNAGAAKYLPKSNVANALIQTIRACTTGRKRAAQGKLTAVPGESASKQPRRQSELRPPSASD